MRCVKALLHALPAEWEAVCYERLDINSLGGQEAEAQGVLQAVGIGNVERDLVQVQQPWLDADLSPMAAVRSQKSTWCMLQTIHVPPAVTSSTSTVASCSTLSNCMQYLHLTVLQYRKDPRMSTSRTVASAVGRAISSWPIPTSTTRPPLRHMAMAACRVRAGREESREEEPRKKYESLDFGCGMEGEGYQRCLKASG